jgi:hypothetical protein
MGEARGRASLPASVLRLGLAALAVLTAGSALGPVPPGAGRPLVAAAALVALAVAVLVALLPHTWVPAGFLVAAIVVRWSLGGGGAVTGALFALLVVAVHVVAAWAATVGIRGRLEVVALLPSLRRYAVVAAAVIATAVAMESVSGTSAAPVVPVALAVAAGPALLLTVALVVTLVGSRWAPRTRTRRRTGSGGG